MSSDIINPSTSNDEVKESIQIPDQNFENDQTNENKQNDESKAEMHTSNLDLSEYNYTGLLYNELASILQKYIVAHNRKEKNKINFNNPSTYTISVIKNSLTHLNQLHPDIRYAFDSNNKICQFYAADEYNFTNRDPLVNDTRIEIIDFNNFKVLSTQGGKILYNGDAYDTIISDEKIISKSNIKEVYDIPVLIVYYHNDTWYVSTKKHIDASKSFYYSGSVKMSHRDMFDELIKDKIKFEDLNKDYYYLFNILHPNEKSYSINYNKKYDIETNYLQDISLVDAYIKYTHENVTDKCTDLIGKLNSVINQNKLTKVSTREHIDNLLVKYDNQTTKILHVAYRGIILKYYPKKNDNRYQLLILECSTYINNKFNLYSVSYKKLHAFMCGTIEDLYSNPEDIDNVINDVNYVLNLFFNEIKEFYKKYKNKDNNNFNINIYGINFRQLLRKIRKLINDKVQFVKNNQEEQANNVEKDANKQKDKKYKNKEKKNDEQMKEEYKKQIKESKQLTDEDIKSLLFGYKNIGFLSKLLIERRYLLNNTNEQLPFKKNQHIDKFVNEFK